MSYAGWGPEGLLESSLKPLATLAGVESAFNLARCAAACATMLVQDMKNQKGRMLKAPTDLAHGVSTMVLGGQAKIKQGWTLRAF